MASSAARITTTVNTAALQKLGTSPAGPIFRHMVTLEAKVETKAKRNASGSVVKVRTGTLRSGIASAPPQVRGTTLVGTVISAASYSVALEKGTKAHDIVPTKKKVLAWKGPDGGPKFSTRVHHPGTKPRRFLSGALDAIR